MAKAITQGITTRVTITSNEIGKMMLSQMKQGG